MREIKFRAWDKKAEKMYYLSEGKDRGIDYQISFWLGGCELVEVTSERGAVVICGKDDTITGSRNDGEFMQFTGLKDKAGKEIYEDDLIEYNEQLYRVCWDEDSGGWYANGVIVAEIETLYYLEDLEVIGNIYQNKELLKI